MDAEDRALAELAKAVGHPARAAIVRLLAGQRECCGAIVTILGLPQSTVSQHLKVLKDAGLICGEVDGARINYCLDRDRLRRLRVLVSELG